MQGVGCVNVDRDRISPTVRDGTSNTVSGMVIGPTVQAGAIHGGVHFHQVGKTPIVPRQLLAAPALFTNREAELALLTDYIGHGERPIAVAIGPGGVGKTALVLRCAHQVQHRFRDGQLFSDLGGWGGGDPADPGDVLGTFLRALGVAPERVPVSLEEQAALFRSITSGKSLLVVLDNAVSAAQVRALMPASGSCAVLVSSRSRLIGLLPDGARLVDVGPLSTEDGLRLLRRTVGEQRIVAEPARARQMAQLCGGLPMALCVAAARLAGRPRLPVSVVAEELADERGRLAALSAVDGLSVEASLDASYRSLAPAAALLYRRLALHPGPDFTVGIPLLLASYGPGEHPATVLDQLVAANLLEDIAEDRFRYHDLLRLHARRKADDDDSDSERTVTALVMLEWYLAGAMRADRIVTPYRRRLEYDFRTTPMRLPEWVARDDALAWMERERVNLLEAGREAMRREWYELAWHLSDVMWPLLLYRKHYRDRLEIDRRGVDAARAWGNRWAEADMRKRLSRICYITGDLEGAAEHIRCSIELCEQEGDERGRIDALAGLASLYRDTGRTGEAVELSRAVLEANRRLGDARAIGLALLNLAQLLTRHGDAAEALDLLAEADQVFAGLAEIDPYNGVRVQTGLAEASLATGDLIGGRAAAEKAAAGMRDLGSDYEHGQALELWGRVAAEQGDAPTAVEALQNAHRLFTAAGSSRATEVQRRLDALLAEPGCTHPGEGVPSADRD